MSKASEEMNWLFRGSWRGCFLEIAGLFGKAKRRLLGHDVEDTVFAVVDTAPACHSSLVSSPWIALNQSLVTGGIGPATWQQQDIGQSASHSD